jgi:hypothetical protein
MWSLDLKEAHGGGGAGMALREGMDRREVGVQAKGWRVE